MTETIRKGLQAKGKGTGLPIVRPCHWFGVPRRSVG
jgi:hypothetical protein